MTNPLSNAMENIVSLFEHRDEREFLPAALEVIETPASPVARLVAWLIILVLVAAIAWAFLGRIDVDATAQGHIVPAGDVKVIQPLDPGAVRAIHVQDGDHVRRGQLLIELDPTDPLADQSEVSDHLTQAKLDVARLRALAGGRFVAPAGAPPDLVAEAEATLHAQVTEQSAKMSDLNQQIAGKTAEIAEARAQLEKIRATLPMLTEKDRINQELVARGYGTTMAALDARQALAETRSGLSVEERQIDAAIAARDALERQREEARAQYQAGVLSELRKAEVAADDTSQQLVKAEEKSSRTELRSPIDGVVQQLAVHTLNGVVAPAQHLMTIVPDTSKMTVEAKLANRDVGFVHVGQPVKLKIETFNFTRYGVIDGQVLSISRDVVSDPPAGADAAAAAAAAPAAGASAASYVARISIANTSILVDGVRRPLQPGMNVTVEIRTGRRTVASYLLSPIARTTQESLHER